MDSHEESRQPLGTVFGSYPRRDLFISLSSNYTSVSAVFVVLLLIYTASLLLILTTPFDSVEPVAAASSVSAHQHIKTFLLSR